MVVVSELLANTIDHGSGVSAMTEAELEVETHMDLEFRIHGGGWRVSVTDQGGGDPEEVRDLLSPTEMPDLEDERGRGFFLLSTMVDRMDVATSDDGKGLTIIATKRLT